MKLTFDYIGTPYCGTGLYGEKALQILQAIYTSSVIWNTKTSTTQLMKPADESKYITFNKDIRRGYSFYPGIGPNGEVEVRLTTYSAVYNSHPGKRDYLLDYIKKDLNAYIGLADDICRVKQDRDTVIAAPAEDGEVQFTIADLKCMKYLLDHNLNYTKKAAAVYGQDRIDSLKGNPRNILETAASKVVVESHDEALKTAYGQYHEAYKGGTITWKLTDEVWDRIKKSLEAVAEKIGGVSEERMKRTFEESVRVVPHIALT